MATEKQIKSAAAVFNTIIRHLDGMKFKYDIMDSPGEGHMIHLTMRGDDLPISLYIIVDADKELIIIKSPEFTKFAADKIDLAAKAVCAINDAILDGSYALNIDTGNVMWTITSCFRGSLVGEETIHYLMGVSVTTLDHYNELFMLLNMGAIDFDTFREKI